MSHLVKLKIQNILDCRFNLVSLFYFLLRFHWLHFLQLFSIFSKFERMQNNWQSIQKEPLQRKFSFSPYSTSFDLRFARDDLKLNVNWELWKKTSDIGIWEGIFRFLAFLSIVTNGAQLAFTSNIVTKVGFLTYADWMVILANQSVWNSVWKLF